MLHWVELAFTLCNMLSQLATWGFNLQCNIVARQVERKDVARITRPLDQHSAVEENVSLNPGV